MISALLRENVKTMLSRLVMYLCQIMIYIVIEVRNSDNHAFQKIKG